jgi:putative effector of murein hydrolase LrgA (UPF0299 family)
MLGFALFGWLLLLLLLLYRLEEIEVVRRGAGWLVESGWGA